MVDTQECAKVRINELELAYKTWGDENSPLILALHGWLDNADTFLEIAPAIAEINYVFAIDFVGHGLSDHRAESASYYLWDYALDILKLIENKKWKNFTILAHSMGTGVAAIIAAVKPKLIQKLVFIDGLGAPFVTGEGEEVTHFQKYFRQMELAKRMGLNGFSIDDYPLFNSREMAIRERMKSTISPLSFNASEILTVRSLKGVKGGYQWRFDPRLVIPECYQMTEKQARLFLSSIECETLIILGEKGLFSDVDKQERIKSIKNVTVEWLKGGHHLHLEEESIKVQLLINQFIKNN